MTKSKFMEILYLTQDPIAEDPGLNELLCMYSTWPSAGYIVN
jgi:hypothetical protein